MEEQQQKKSLGCSWEGVTFFSHMPAHEKGLFVGIEIQRKVFQKLVLKENRDFHEKAAIGSSCLLVGAAESAFVHVHVM